ncbi:PGLP [Ectocarpus sp. CCAP 1310/34]|nr:PGLP [Ectocarpus sp. CCAP 1310/34]
MLSMSNGARQNCHFSTACGVTRAGTSLRGVAQAKARPVSRTMRMANSQRLGDPIGQMLDKTDVFIFDCDGVIWKGDSLIEGIPSVLDRLRQAGKRIFFVTNNSTKSRKGYKSKFDSLGLSVEPEEIFSSSFAAAAYLEQTRFKDTGKKVHGGARVSVKYGQDVGAKVGGQADAGIEEELDLIGVPHFGGPSDGSKGVELKPGFALPHDENVGAVVVGFDRMINYYKIQYAQLCINENPGCEFIATNTDAVTHLTDAQEWAGNGAMVGAIKGCTGVEPTIVGKPGPLMIDYIIQKYNVERSRICMVGDRLDTDVLFGANNGLMSILTLSGVTTEEKLLSPENKINPDYYVNSINDFFPYYT